MTFAGAMVHMRIQRHLQEKLCFCQNNIFVTLKKLLRCQGTLCFGLLLTLGARVDQSSRE